MPQVDRGRWREERESACVYISVYTSRCSTPLTRGSRCWAESMVRLANALDGHFGGKCACYSSESGKCHPLGRKKELHSKIYPRFCRDTGDSTHFDFIFQMSFQTEWVWFSLSVTYAKHNCSSISSNLKIICRPRVLFDLTLAFERQFSQYFVVQFRVADKHASFEQFNWSTLNTSYLKTISLDILILRFSSRNDLSLPIIVIIQILIFQTYLFIYVY